MKTRLVLALATALASAACSSPDDASGDMHLELVQAPTKVTPGAATPQSVLVKVVNGDGTSISGVPVTWSVRSGGGHLTPSADTSGVDGLAAAQWTPGLATGSQAIGASIYNQPALTITVNADAFRADKIATAYRSGCGLKGSDVWCWDYSYGANASVLHVVPELQARDIELSGSFLCVLEQAGSVHCQRALGDPTLEPMGTVQGLPPLAALSTGTSSGSFCGLAQADGTPWCWDRNTLTASQRSATLSLTQMSGDAFRGCGLTSTGAAWCWGYVTSDPELLPGGQLFREVSAGVWSGCAIKAPTELYCWDAGDPTPRNFGISASQVAVGNSAQLINASLGATEFYFWALNPPEYHLGDPFPLPVTQVSSQDDTPCVIAYDAAVYCLGVNDNVEQVYKTTWEAIPALQP